MRANGDLEKQAAALIQHKVKARKTAGSRSNLQKCNRTFVR